MCLQTLLRLLRMLLTVGAIAYMVPLLPGATRVHGCYMGAPFSGLRFHDLGSGVYLAQGPSDELTFAPSLERLLVHKRISRTSLKQSGTPHFLFDEPTVYKGLGNTQIIVGGCGAMATKAAPEKFSQFAESFNPIGPPQGVMLAFMAALTWCYPVLKWLVKLLDRPVRLRTPPGPAR